jgi:alpha-glucosidase
MNPPPLWWQTAVIYELYPRSFQDSNGDGIGDLRGIIRRLPHLGELGVNAIWLTPIFRSPMADFGYDIADYTDIDPIFGDVSDFDELLAAAHARGLKIILDLVPNHTSDEHSWFIESRSSRDNPKRDWYIWRDPAPDGGAPTNWCSEFGGSAWEYDSATRQYYYHAFLAKQPDLNWRNPQVRAAVYDAMRFWLQRGVDGFRIDVIWHLIKDDQFRDNPPNPGYNPERPPHESVIPLYTTDRPEVHDIIREMRRVTEEFPERLLIGEIYLPVERLVTYYGQDLDGLHLPFNFALLFAPWRASNLAKLIEEYEVALPRGGWPNWVLGNHDRPRIAGRLPGGQARIAAMLLLTLRGTPTIYYGDEIGMEQQVIPPERVRDPFEKNVPGLGVGRDGCRTPMQWDATAHAGFAECEAWLPISHTYREQNVAVQREDKSSLYNLYRRLIMLRRSRLSLSIGRYRPLYVSGELLVFVREHEQERMLVALNLGQDPASFAFESRVLAGRVLISSFGDRDGEVVSKSLELRGDEGAIVELSRESILPGIGA